MDAYEDYNFVIEYDISGFLFIFFIFICQSRVTTFDYGNTYRIEYSSIEDNFVFVDRIIHFNFFFLNYTICKYILQYA